MIKLFVITNYPSVCELLIIIFPKLFSVLLQTDKRQLGLLRTTIVIK